MLFSRNASLVTIGIGQMAQNRLLGIRQRRLLRRALRTPGMADAIYAEFADEIDGEASPDLPAGAEAALGDGSIIRWILDNPDKVLAFVEMIIKIIGMFGAQAGPSLPSRTIAGGNIRDTIEA